MHTKASIKSSFLFIFVFPIKKKKSGSFERGKWQLVFAVVFFFEGHTCASMYREQDPGGKKKDENCRTLQSKTIKAEYEKKIDTSRVNVKWRRSPSEKRAQEKKKKRTSVPRLTHTHAPFNKKKKELQWQREYGEAAKERENEEQKKNVTNWGLFIVALNDQHKKKKRTTEKERALRIGKAKDEARFFLFFFRHKGVMQSRSSSTGAAAAPLLGLASCSVQTAHSCSGCSASARLRCSRQRHRRPHPPSHRCRCNTKRTPVPA